MRVTVQNWQRTLYELAHKEIIQECAFIADYWAPILTRNLNLETTFGGMRERLAPTAQNVIKTLRPEGKGTRKEDAIMEYLKKFIRHSTPLRLQKFLRFCDAWIIHRVHSTCTIHRVHTTCPCRTTYYLRVGIHICCGTFTNGDIRSCHPSKTCPSVCTWAGSAICTWAGSATSAHSASYSSPGCQQYNINTVRRVPHHQSTLYFTFNQELSPLRFPPSSPY